MQANTLYYTLSVMPQVIAAIAAVLAAFTFFRISNLRDYLVGDGKSILKRWGIEHGYGFSEKRKDEVQRGRLRDAVDRQNIPEIRNVLFLLQQNEKDEGYSKEDRPHGVQYLYEDRFCVTENYIGKLKTWTLRVLTVSFISIVASVVSLALTDVIMSPTCIFLRYSVLWLNIIVFLASLCSAIYLVYLGLFGKTPHETDRQDV